MSRGYIPASLFSLFFILSIHGFLRSLVFTHTHVYICIFFFLLFQGLLCVYTGQLYSSLHIYNAEKESSRRGFFYLSIENNLPLVYRRLYSRRIFPIQLARVCQLRKKENARIHVLRGERSLTRPGSLTRHYGILKRIADVLHRSSVTPSTSFSRPKSRIIVTSRQTYILPAIIFHCD